MTNSYMLKRDISFVFEKGLWRCKIRGVPIYDPLATDFAQVAQNFMTAMRYDGGNWTKENPLSEPSAR